MRQSKMSYSFPKRKLHFKACILLIKVLPQMLVNCLGSHMENKSNPLETQDALSLDSKKKGGIRLITKVYPTVKKGISPWQ